MTVWARILHKSFAGPVGYVDIGRTRKAHGFKIPSIPFDVRSPLHRLGLVLNLGCNRHSSFLQQASYSDGFNSSYHWLLFGVHNLNHSVSILNELNINIDAYLTLAVGRVEARDTYAMYDVYGSVKARGGKLTVDYLGDSTPTSGWPKAKRRRQNLQQIELRAVVSSMNQHQPSSIETYLSSAPGKPRTYNAPKYAYQLVEILQTKFNFRLKLVLASSWHLDVIGTNSSLGVIGQLQTKQVDFSLVPLALQTERMSIFDPTIEIARGKFFTLFRHPKYAMEGNIFLRPFQTIIWIVMPMLLVCSAALLSAIFIVQRTTAIRALPGALLIVLGVLAQQAVVLAGKMTFANSEKLLLLVLFACCMILLQFYSSFIIGYQLIETPKTINTMEQLIATGMPVSIENLTYNRDFFMRTKDPVAIDLYHRRILPNRQGFVNVSTGIALVRQGGHAFHCETTYGYTHVSETFTERQVCELHHVFLYPHRVTHIPMVKGSPLKELFKLQLQIVRESGVLAYHQHRYYATRPRCIKDSHQTEPVELFDVISAFVLLASGLLCSCFLLLAEVAFRRCSTRVELIEEFLQQRSITSLIVLHCVQEQVDQDVIRMAKTLRKSFPGTIYYTDISKLNFKQQFHRHMFYERYKTAITLNLECSGMDRVLEQLSANAYFNGTFHWLMFGGRNFEQAICLLSDQNINYDTSITLVFDGYAPENISRYEVYEVTGTVKRRGGRIHFELLGIVSSLEELPKRIAPTRGLDGIELRTTLTTANQHQPRPFIEKLNSVKRPKSYNAVSHSYQMVKLLQMKLKFKLIMILASDWRFDLIGQNSSQGVVGQLETKQVDFGITPFAMTVERVFRYDFTIEIARGTFYTVFRHPKSLNNNNIFLLPFETLLWIVIGLTFCGVAVIQTISIVCNPQTVPAQSRIDCLVDQSLLGTLGVLCQQGLHHRIILMSSNKILILVAMAFSMLLLQFYSTFIVGYQLITPPKTINTLEKLVDSNIKMAVENLSYQYDFFRRTKNPVALKLYETKILPNKYGFVNLTFGLQLVKRGGYAFHCETSYGNTLIIETFTEREICELQQVQLYPQRAVHLTMIKGSPLRELFKVNLQLVKERGLLAYHHSRNYIPQPKCNKQSNNHAEQIYLTDVRFAFLLLGAGMAASIAMLSWELAFERFQHWRGIRHQPPDGFVWLN
uniref:Ionotropic glutamate receptor C-terminal domain-containing protein n=1 Tax=Anopheles minimus TaxID=112268 RepID=A0A182VQS8_9DIPT